MLEAKDLNALCAAVRIFSLKAELRFKGMPVITWEFADIRDFMNTRAMVLQAMSPEMMPASVEQMRRIGEDVVEIDCQGVTFRLVCKQKRMMRDGPYGANELPEPPRKPNQ